MRRDRVDTEAASEKCRKIPATRGNPQEDLNMAKKITKFDVPTLKMLDPDLNEALAKVGKKYGINIEMDSGGKYETKTATLKIKLTVLNEDGTVFDKEREAFLQQAERLRNNGAGKVFL